jgi:hypothetical protein
MKRLDVVLAAVVASARSGASRRRCPLECVAAGIDARRGRPNGPLSTRPAETTFGGSVGGPRESVSCPLRLPRSCCYIHRMRGLNGLMERLEAFWDEVVARIDRLAVAIDRLALRRRLRSRESR